jgi:hypothetical protein
MYKSSSAAERATLYHQRNKFHHRSVKKNVMENVEHVTDLLENSTDGGIGLLAMKLLGVSKEEDVMVKEGDPFDFIHNLATQIVDNIWPMVDEESIQKVICGANDEDSEVNADEDDENKLYCSCQQLLDDDDGSFFDEMIWLLKWQI